MPSMFDRQEAFARARGEQGLNQDQLVRRLRQIATPKIQSHKRLIPMGNMLPELLTTQTEMEEAVYTWLRSSSEWEELTIQFSNDPSQYKVEEVLAVRFPDPKSDTPAWKRDSDGLWQLRETIAKLLMNNDNILKVHIERKGISLFLDASKKFGPYKKATAADVAAFNDEIDRLIEEQKQQASVNGLEYTPPDIDRMKVGDAIANEDFVPQISWVKEVRGVGIQD